MLDLADPELKGMRCIVLMLLLCVVVLLQLPTRRVRSLGASRVSAQGLGPNGRGGSDAGHADAMRCNIKFIIFTRNLCGPEVLRGGRLILLASSRTSCSWFPRPEHGHFTFFSLAIRSKANCSGKRFVKPSAGISSVRPQPMVAASSSMPSRKVG